MVRHLKVVVRLEEGMNRLQLRASLVCVRTNGQTSVEGLQLYEDRLPAKPLGLLRRLVDVARLLAPRERVAEQVVRREWRPPRLRP